LQLSDLLLHLFLHRKVIDGLFKNNLHLRLFQVFNLHGNVGIDLRSLLGIERVKQKLFFFLVNASKQGGVANILVV
jgi:hypothetical protein